MPSQSEFNCSANQLAMHRKWQKPPHYRPPRGRKKYPCNCLDCSTHTNHYCDCRSSHRASHLGDDGTS